MKYFEYGAREAEYLKSKDRRLAAVIDRLGHIYRECDDDLFSSVVNSIVGQQISTKAHRTVWKRMTDALGRVDADSVLASGREQLKSFGLSYRKADYILDFAEKVKSGEFDPQAVAAMDDASATAALCSLKGVGVWTAEMILLFCLQRPDVFSYGDFGIRHGVKLVYHHRELDRERFERYRRRFSPYCSVASLYFWAVAGGALDNVEKP